MKDRRACEGIQKPGPFVTFSRAPPCSRSALLPSASLQRTFIMGTDLVNFIFLWGELLQRGGPRETQPPEVLSMERLDRDWVAPLV